MAILAVMYKRAPQPINEMNNKKAIRLIQKYQQGELSSEEEHHLNEWYLLTVAESKNELTREQIQQTVERLRSKLPLQEPVKKAKLWPRIAVAAAVILIVVSVVFFRSGLQSDPNSGSQYVNDVAPGKVGATLKLANGKVIRLTDAKNGELAKEAGIRVTKTADGQLTYDASNLPERTADQDTNPAFNTLSTNRGETYMLILPDKSKVWMNAASTLTYPTTLKVHGVRRVKLEGEAYFEITKDREHPFVVEAKGQEVEVLGTHFNVNAYSDEPSKTTTLLEGMVKVTSDQNQLTLKPGEQASYNGQSITKSATNVENAIDWKRGEFNLDHLNFKIAMRKIARWYNVEVIYNFSVPEDMEIGGWVSRTEQLSSVLKSMESAGLVHFKIDGRKIYVIK
jgi:transmembrane sensor